MVGYYWGTQQTPQAIRTLVWTTALITLIAACSEMLFSQLLGTKGPQDFLGLSWYGFRHYYIWQPISYLFVQEVASDGISFLYLISLFLSMYILWLIGSMLVERMGSVKFYVLYFLCGILAGLTALFAMPVIGSFVLITGPAAALLAISVVWVMYFPDTELTFFFLFPIQAKWLLAGTITAIALLCLSRLDFISLIFYLSGVLYGYLFGVLVLKLKSPYAFLEPIYSALRNFSSVIRRKFTSEKEPEVKSKIVDITTGSPIIDDEAFVDAMLAKIARQGEKALTRSERKRMDEISARKAKK